MEFTRPAEAYIQGHSAWHSVLSYSSWLLRPGQEKVGTTQQKSITISAENTSQSGSCMADGHQEGSKEKQHPPQWARTSSHADLPVRLGSAFCTSPFLRGTQMVSALKALSKIVYLLKLSTIYHFCLLFLFGPFSTPMRKRFNLGYSFYPGSSVFKHGPASEVRQWHWAPVSWVLDDISSRYMLGWPLPGLKVSGCLVVSCSDDAVAVLEEEICALDDLLHFVGPLSASPCYTGVYID